VRTAAEGFGFEPSESQHHFQVRLSGKPEDPIYITEHFQLEPAMDKATISFALGREDQKIRVVLPRAKWDAIADEVRAEFNRRLKTMGLRAGQWNTTSVPVSRLFGKELVLIAWAIEDADPALIPTAIQNWAGLRPEERWWLYTMTNGATGHAISGRNKGWRKAVRFALTENPVTVLSARMSENDFHLVNETGERLSSLPAHKSVRLKGKRPQEQGS
jgi:uncharacterized protein DUF3780